MSVGKNRRTGTVRSKSTKVVSHGICGLDTCGKMRYASRKDAKTTAKRLFPGDHLTAYECDGWWHIGHPPQRVIHGKGWGSEDRLTRQAARVHNEVEQQLDLSCEACGLTVTWLPGKGYEHACEVTGVDDELR